MRLLAILLALSLSACEPKDEHDDDHGSAPVSAPSVWDSDMPLSTTWTQPAVPSGQAYWRLVEAHYYPPGESASVGGDHHIFFQAKGLDGTLLEGQMGSMLTNGANPVYALTKGAVDNYAGNFPIWASGWCGTPIDTLPGGPYSFLMAQDGLPGTRVDGMGLHCNYHMTWWLVYQKTIAP